MKWSRIGGAKQETGTQISARTLIAEERSRNVRARIVQSSHRALLEQKAACFDAVLLRRNVESAGTVNIGEVHQGTLKCDFVVVALDDVEKGLSAEPILQILFEFYVFHRQRSS
jgi:hypothetical protein